MKKIIVTWFVPESFKDKVCKYLGVPVWHPNRSLASVWIRGYQVASYLKKMGYKILINTLFPKPHAAIFLRRYSSNDYIIARNLKRRGTKIILDAVVNYFEKIKTNYDFNPVTNELVEVFHRMIDICDQIWCVSPFLQKIGSKYHSNVHFIADSVDSKHFHNSDWKDPNDGDKIILGWSGYSKKASSLVILEPLIRNNRTQLIVITDKPPNLPFQYTFVKWNYFTFPSYIRKCHLCVAPREVSDDYNRGHSFFKIGVFMAMGIPSIAGNVPSYRLLINSKSKSGAIALTSKEWLYYFNRFLEDRDLRLRWHYGALRAIDPYLTPKIAKQIHILLTKLLNE